MTKVTRKPKSAPSSPKKKKQVRAPPNIKIKRKEEVARVRAKIKNVAKKAKKKLTWDSSWKAPAYGYHCPRKAATSAMTRVGNDYLSATIPGHAWSQSRLREIAHETARDCQRWSNQLDRIPKNENGVMSGLDAKNFLLNL